MREAEVDRKTGETEISMKINLDGKGDGDISSPIGFLSHMLETFARHGTFDLEAFIKGDVHVDQHHTVEDTGISLGELFKKALGDKKGIRRAGFFIFPMDETLASCAIDVSGRPFLKTDFQFNNKKVGDFDTDLVVDFFQGFVSSLGATLHLKVEYGRSDHHKIEGLFKAFARAMKEACSIDEKIGDNVPSTKGVL